MFRTYYWRRSLEYLQYIAAKATQRQVDISVRITVAATRPLLCFSDLLAALSPPSWVPHIFCKTTTQNKIHFTRISNVEIYMISRGWMAFCLLSIALKVIYIYRTDLQSCLWPISWHFLPVKKLILRWNYIENSNRIFGNLNDNRRTVNNNNNA